MVYGFHWVIWLHIEKEKCCIVLLYTTIAGYYELLPISKKYETNVNTECKQFKITWKHALNNFDT